MAAACFELGQHLHRHGHQHDAVRWFREAHRLAPENWTYKRQAWTFADPLQGPTEQYESDWLTRRPRAWTRALLPGSRARVDGSSHESRSARPGKKKEGCAGGRTRQARLPTRGTRQHAPRIPSAFPRSRTIPARKSQRLMRKTQRNSGRRDREAVRDHFMLQWPPVSHQPSAEPEHRAAGSARAAMARAGARRLSGPSPLRALRSRSAAGNARRRAPAAADLAPDRDAAGRRRRRQRGICDPAQRLAVLAAGSDLDRAADDTRRRRRRLRDPDRAASGDVVHDLRAVAAAAGAGRTWAHVDGPRPCDPAPAQARAGRGRRHRRASSG